MPGERSHPARLLLRTCLILASVAGAVELLLMGCEHPCDQKPCLSSGQLLA